MSREISNSICTCSTFDVECILLDIAVDWLPDILHDTHDDMIAEYWSIVERRSAVHHLGSCGKNPKISSIFLALWSFIQTMTRNAPSKCHDWFVSAKLQDKQGQEFDVMAALLLPAWYCHKHATGRFQGCYWLWQRTYSCIATYSMGLFYVVSLWRLPRRNAS